MPDQDLRHQMISGVDCLRNFQWEENYTLLSKQIANESRKKAVGIKLKEWELNIGMNVAFATKP